MKRTAVYAHSVGGMSSRLAAITFRSIWLLSTASIQRSSSTRQSTIKTDAYQPSGRLDAAPVAHGQGPHPLCAEDALSGWNDARCVIATNTARPCPRGVGESCHALPALAGVRKTADYTGLHPAGSD
jgi:hypothetical protein